HTPPHFCGYIRRLQSRSLLHENTPDRALRSFCEQAHRLSAGQTFRPLTQSRKNSAESPPEARAASFSAAAGFQKKQPKRTLPFGAGARNRPENTLSPEDTFLLCKLPRRLLQGQRLLLISSF